MTGAQGSTLYSHTASTANKTKKSNLNNNVGSLNNNPLN